MHYYLGVMIMVNAYGLRIGVGCVQIKQSLDLGI